MSKVTSLDSLYDDKERPYIPPPRGCMECYIPAAARKATCACCPPTRSTCMHVEHFSSIKTDFDKRGFFYVGCGGSRTTYSRKGSNYVYKVPSDRYGYLDNWFESLVWQERAHLRAHNIPMGDRIARCSMLPSGVLVMEKMENARHWAHSIEMATQIDPTLANDPATTAFYDIDGGQGGFDRNKHFRLYDYTHGTHLVEDPALAQMMAI
jgi:hypothetical protein